MNKLIFFVFLIVGFVSGCAALEQARQDINTGNNTPLTINETITPAQQAAQIGNTVASLPVPFAPVAGGVVTFIAGLFLAWHRGVLIRKQGAVPASSVTNVNVASGLIQDLASVFTGAFTVASTTDPSPSASIWQRVWKVLLATAVSGAAAVVADPALASFLTAHPITAGVLGMAPSIILGIEKAFSNVPAVMPMAASAEASTKPV